MKIKPIFEYVENNEYFIDLTNSSFGKVLKFSTLMDYYNICNTRKSNLLQAIIFVEPAITISHIYYEILYGNYKKVICCNYSIEFVNIPNGRYQEYSILHEYNNVINIDHELESIVFNGKIGGLYDNEVGTLVINYEIISIDNSEFQIKPMGFLLDFEIKKIKELY